MRLPYIKTAAVAVLITFLSSNILPQGWSAPVSETQAPVPFDLKIPGNLASIDSLISGHGPAVLHIQTAHGNYESQKKIQSLLHYLDQRYGFKTLFVEGSPFDIEPEAIRFFPKQMPLTMKINDELARKSIVKGSELFLAEAEGAKAYGIEDLATYKANGEAFKAVLRAQPETEQFVRSLDLQIGRLSSVLINKDLRLALDRLEAFQEGHIGLGQRLAELSSLAQKHLKLEFTNVRSQTEWPMLVRYFKVTAWEKEIQAAPLAEEKKKFLEVIKSFPRKNEIEQLLDSSNVQNGSPEQLESLAEQLAAWLPQSFDPSLYPNVNRSLGIQLLQSEIQGRLLADEMERLSDSVLKQLAQNEQEEKILKELKNYSTLNKLFRLELTPSDYEHVLSEKENLIPSHIAARFQALNTQDRVQNLVFEHLEALDNLYQKALEFYRFVKQRDEIMLRRLNEQMKEKKIEKAVVVTGGFHSAPFEDYFRKAGLNYALLSPRITHAPEEGERQAYIDAVFQNNIPSKIATYDTPTIALSRNRLAQLHSLPWLDRQIDSAYRFAGATRAENRGGGKVTIETLHQLKAQGIPITMLTAYDENDAALLEQGGVDLIFVGDSGGMVRLGKSSTQEVTMEMMEGFARSVQKGIRNAHFVVDMPHESYLTPEQALINAKRFVEIGAESIKLEGGEEVAPVVRYLVDHGIPVMGHIAYTPQSKQDHKVVGSDAEGAKQLLKDALAVEDAGAYAVVIELADREVSRWISKALKIPTIGIGAGAGTDGQVLVLDDLLGWTQAKWQERRPKYGVPAMVGREYWSWGEDPRDPKETLRVVRSFVEKTHSREFPGVQNSFHKYAGEPLDQVLQPILDEYRSRHEARDEKAYQGLKDAFDEALADVNRWADRYGNSYPDLKNPLLSFSQSIAALTANQREKVDTPDDRFLTLSQYAWEDRFSTVMDLLNRDIPRQRELGRKLDTLKQAGILLLISSRAEGRAIQVQQISLNSGRPEGFFAVPDESGMIPLRFLIKFNEEYSVAELKGKIQAAVRYSLLDPKGGEAGWSNESTDIPLEGLRVEAAGNPLVFKFEGKFPAPAVRGSMVFNLRVLIDGKESWMINRTSDNNARLTFEPLPPGWSFTRFSGKDIPKLLEFENKLAYANEALRWDKDDFQQAASDPTVVSEYLSDEKGIVVGFFMFEVSREEAIDAIFRSVKRFSILPEAPDKIKIGKFLIDRFKQRPLKNLNVFMVHIPESDQEQRSLWESQGFSSERIENLYHHGEHGYRLTLTPGPFPGSDGRFRQLDYKTTYDYWRKAVIPPQKITALARLLRNSTDPNISPSFEVPPASLQPGDVNESALALADLWRNSGPIERENLLDRVYRYEPEFWGKYADGIRPWLLWLLMDRDFKVRRKVVEINDWFRETPQGGKLGLRMDPELLMRHFEEPWLSIAALGQPDQGEASEQSYFNKRIAIMTLLISNATLRSLDPNGPADYRASWPLIESYRKKTSELLEKMFYEKAAPQIKGNSEAWTRGILEKVIRGGQYALGATEKLSFWEGVYIGLARFRRDYPISSSPYSSIDAPNRFLFVLLFTDYFVSSSPPMAAMIDMLLHQVIHVSRRDERPPLPPSPEPSFSPRPKEGDESRFEAREISDELLETVSPELANAIKPVMQGLVYQQDDVPRAEKYPRIETGELRVLEQQNLKAAGAVIKSMLSDQKNLSEIYAAVEPYIAIVLRAYEDEIEIARTKDLSKLSKLQKNRTNRQVLHNQLADVIELLAKHYGVSIVSDHSVYSLSPASAPSLRPAQVRPAVSKKTPPKKESPKKVSRGWPLFPRIFSVMSRTWYFMHPFIFNWVSFVGLVGFGWYLFYLREKAEIFGAEPDEDNFKTQVLMGFFNLLMVIGGLAAAVLPVAIFKFMKTHSAMPGGSRHRETARPIERLSPERLEKLEERHSDSEGEAGTERSEARILPEEVKAPDRFVQEYGVWKVGDYEITEFGAAVIKGPGVWQKENGTVVRQDSGLAVPGGIPLMLPANARTVGGNMITRSGSSVNVLASPLARAVDSLVPGEKHQLHGFTDKVKWFVTATSDDSITFSLNSDEVMLSVEGAKTLADIIGKVSFAQTYKVESGTLTSQLEIKNLEKQSFIGKIIFRILDFITVLFKIRTGFLKRLAGRFDKRVVLGGGYHPFYQVENIKDWTVQIPANHYWAADAVPLPQNAKPYGVLSSGLDFRHPQPLTYGLEAVLSEFIPDTEGQVSVILKNVKTGEVKKISFPYEDFSSLLLWVPPQDKAPAPGIFSIEPLLSIPNGRNLFLSGNEEAQTLVLGPGQTHTASWSVETRSEMRSATYHEEQKRVLKLLEHNQAMPADDAQKDVLLKAMEGLSMSALERKLARKLPKAIDSAEPIKQVRRTKWDEVHRTLKDLLDRGRIYVSADADLSSIQLAGDLVVLSAKLFENSPSRFELLQMMLAKEAVVILEGKKPVQGKNLPPTVFEKQLKGFGAVAGLYYLLFSNEQDASRIALNGPTSNLSGNDVGAHPFGFIRILYKIFTDRERGGNVNESAQAIGSEFLKRWSGASREELTAEALNILSVEPGDRMDPFDERFLSSTVSHPIQVKSEEDGVIWTRESPETGNKVEIKFASIQPQPGEERMIFSADFHRGPEYAKGQAFSGQYLRIFVSEDPDYGTVYRIVTRGEEIKNLFGEPMPYQVFAFPGRLVAFLETLEARSRSVQNSVLNAAIQNWKSFLRREPYEVIDHGWDQGRDVAKTSRFAPFTRVELARQIARANEERLREVVRQQQIRDAEIARNEEAELRRQRFQLGNIETVAIRFIGEEDPAIAQEIKRQFEAIGFKNVTTDERMAPFAEIVLFVSKGDLPEGVLTEADILFHQGQRVGGIFDKIFVYDTRKKEMARMQSSLYASSSWSLRSEVSGYRRYEQAYHIKTPALAAEFAAKEVVTDLENSRKNQAPEEVNAMVSLEYEHPPVVYEMDASHVSQMVQLLGAAETMIQITSDEERRQVQSSRLIFNGRPFYEFRDKKPYLIFDDLDYEGFLRLKEEEEVEINFEGISFSGRALVVESQDGRLVTTVPMGLELSKQIPQVTGGSIMKRYNGVTAEVQQAFLRDVMEDVNRHPLVATALGIDYPRETEDRNRTSMIQLENAKIAQHPEQVEMIAHAINGQNIELGWGPPGTGKTTIAAEVLYQNYKEGISQIVAAQTNRAVDNLLLKAKEKGVKVYRLGNHPQVIDPALRENWIYADRPQKPREPKSSGSQEEREKYEQQLREWKDAYEKWKAGLVEEIFSGRAVVGGTITGIAIDSFLREVERDQNRSRYATSATYAVRFRRGIVEEASVASFAELLLAFSKIEEKVLVIGDPKQLGVAPVVGEMENRLKVSIEQEQLDVLQTSLFEFLLHQNRFPVTMLRDNFRSTPLQVKATNFWYGGKLRAMKNVPEDVNRNSLIVIDTHLLPDTEEQPGGTSWQNKTEAQILEDVLRSLKSEVSVHDVGMITPYQSQIREIKNRIKRLLRGASPNDVQIQMSNIGTVWPFQGRELPLIFVSAVRSNKPEEKRGGRVVSNTGFASGEMWNVETSRGEWTNVLIFNSATFQASRQPQVPEFIDHVLRLAQEEGIYIELKPGESNENSFARAAQAIDRNMAYAGGQKRAEAREIPATEETLSASTSGLISAPLSWVTRVLRGGILPYTAMTALIANGKLADALDRVLGKEKAPAFATPAGGYLRSELKIRGSVSFSEQFFEENAALQSRVFAERAWLEKIAENPRALFLFLKAAQPDGNNKAFVTAFLPQSEMEKFPEILARALETKTAASGAELEELNALKAALLAGHLIDFRMLPAGQSEQEALERGADSEKVSGAVVWYSGTPEIAQDTQTAHFSSGAAASEDMPLIVLAALLSRKLGEQTSQLALKPELLKEQTHRFLQQVLPGFQLENGVVSPFNLASFALEAAASQYIATQA